MTIPEASQLVLQASSLDLLPWLMQHRVLTDDEVRRDLRRWVPEYQAAVAPTLQSVPVRAASNG